MKVLFWNVQGSGGNPTSLATINLTEDLAGLAERCPSADVIILCEVYGQYGRHEYAKPAAWSEVPIQGNLYTDTMLRYAVYRRNGVSVNAARLLKTHEGSPDSRMRPAVGIETTGGTVIGLHALSGQSTPQVPLHQLDTACGAWTGRRPVDVLIGDFNVDVGNGATRALATNIVRGKKNLARFELRCTRTPTHRSGSTLDWMLKRPEVPASLRVIAPEDDSQGTYYECKFTGRKSDHLPILGSW